MPRTAATTADIQTRIESFPPAGTTKARVLILGSMPGEASLLANQYYANPRNHFWNIMGELFGAEPSLRYTTRLKILAGHKIALWDVLQSCVRKGSLDTAIADEIPNDFIKFFATHPHITHIFFNGTKAEQSFKKLIMPKLSRNDLVLTRLPSTSPAHAGRKFEAKLGLWRSIEAVLKN